MKSEYILSILAAAAIALPACSPDNPELREPSLKVSELVEGKAFTITHDAQNPNIVYLKSLLPAGYQVAWETPQGRSVSDECTLKIAFDGDYQVRMGVDTQAGYIWSDPATFHIDDFCTDFVDNFLWTRLSGGVGQSKTWQLDLALLDDGSVKTTFWKGPHWFFNTLFTWDHLHSRYETETAYANYINSVPWDYAEAINPAPTGVDQFGDESNWYWAADYASNSWMCTAANYGYMTFDLIEGAHVTITDASGNTLGKGTYILDVDNHTLSFSDVYPLSSEELTGSRTFKILYLSDTAIQLINEGNNKSLNYVTQDFFDNYVPDATPEPELPEGWMKDVTTTSSTTLTWTISAETPLNWCTMSGEFMNDWPAASDYPDWLGTVDPAVYAGFTMTLNSSDGSALFTLPDGSETATTFTLDTKGIFTFADAVAPFALVGWAQFHLSADNALRIMQIEKDDDGNVSGMWLGAKDPDKDEYLAYHFLLDK